LTYWRRRLAASERPQRIFEVVREVITSTGVLAGKTRRALDSTVLDDAVARQDTVTQLIASIRRVAREVDGAPALVSAHCTRLAVVARARTTPPRASRGSRGTTTAPGRIWSPHWSTTPWRCWARWTPTPSRRRAGSQPRPSRCLALVAGQDVEPAQGSDGTDGRWRIARKTAPDRVISTVDPEARHAHKTRERRQDGFKAHVVVEPDTGLMTKVALTKTNGSANSDATVGADLVTTDPTLADGADVQVLGDSAYASGPMLATLAKRNWEPVLKPWPLRPAVADGFTLDDFTHDPHERTMTCPAGTTRAVSTKGTVTYGVACRGCPLRQRCTTSAKGRTITIGEHHQLQREHRQRAEHPDFQGVYRQHRPMVERSIAWLTRGNRRVPYRGVDKNNAWLHHRAAALNLRRLLALGLTHQDGVWALT
jgi:hypothetical protein